MSDTALDLLLAEQAHTRALAARKEAIANEAAALEALNAARVAHAASDAHEWAGKKVRRKVTQRGSYTPWSSQPRSKDRIITQRGVVTLCERTATRFNDYRNYSPTPGEWFVLSSGGITAYALTDGWELDA
jgi:hypothetical protein